MDGTTLADAIVYLARGGREVLDFTGGAPELNGVLPPHHCAMETDYKREPAADPPSRS